MRVKVGNTWHEVTAGTPIMVVFSDADKRNIANMPPEATKYAVFPDDDPRTKEEKLEWMEDDHA